MSTDTPAAQESAATTRRIDDDRLTRALAETMTVTDHAPGMFDVRHDDETYVVDVDGGACGCKDHEFRGDSVVCKHVLRACVTHAFGPAANTRLVARVLAAVRDLGCVHDAPGCNGPTAPDDDGLIPCEDCIAATPGHWTVYSRLVAGREAREPVPTDADTETPAVATDGGTAVETCDRCPTPLADVHAAHEATVVTTEGEELCPTCSESRSGEEIGFVTGGEGDE